MCSCPVFPEPFIEEAVFAPLFPPLSKIRYPQVHGFISGLSILFHWSILLFLCLYHTVLMAVALQCSLKSERLISILLSQDCSGHLRSLGTWALVSPWHVKSSQTRDQPHVLCIDRWIPIHSTSREVIYLKFHISELK